MPYTSVPQTPAGRSCQSVDCVPRVCLSPTNFLRSHNIVLASRLKGARHPFHTALPGQQILTTTSHLYAWTPPLSQMEMDSEEIEPIGSACHTSNAKVSIQCASRFQSLNLPTDLCTSSPRPQHQTVRGLNLPAGWIR